MSKSYDIIIKVTIKDVRVTEGRATQQQVARAVCQSIVGKYGTSPMDLFGLDHGREVTSQLHDSGVDAGVEFWGNARCEVSASMTRTTKREGNPVSVRKRAKNSVSLRSIMAKAGK